MKLGIAQIHTQIGNLDGIADRIAVQARAAADRGADLLVFPLTTLNGPTPVPFARQDEFLADVATMLTGLSAHLACPCLIPLVLEVHGMLTYDAVLLTNDSVRLLRDYMSFDISEGPLTFTHAGSTIGLALSYNELGAFVASTDSPSVDIIVCLSDLEYAIDDPACASAASGDVSIAALAEMADVWIGVVASVGGYGSHVFLGASYVVAPDGAMVATAPACDEALLVADVGPGADMSSQAMRVPYDEPYYLWQALVMGVRDYVCSLGNPDVMLWLDGHPTTAILAAIATDALGPTHVHAVLATALEREEAVQELADNLHIDVDSLAIPSALDVLSDIDRVQFSLACSAYERNALLLSPLNKTALALGEGCPTLSATAFAPLADVLLSDLLAAAHVRNAISPVFPETLLTVSSDVLPHNEDIALPNEAALEQLDGIIVAYVTGETDMLAHVPATLLSVVLARLNTLSDRMHSLVAPFLSMSSYTLFETCLPLGFGWKPTLRTLDSATFLPASHGEMQLVDHLDIQDDTSPHSDESAVPSPPDFKTVQGALRETLDLLRDLSMGDSGDWSVPFSEN